MAEADPTFINEEFYADHVSPRELDVYLNNACRHFGTHFFRYSLGIYEFDIRRVIPLRINLAAFSFSKSQRRIFQKNKDLQTTIQKATISGETIELFERHKRRFKDAVPESIYEFLSAEPATIPCETLEVVVRDEKMLLAASFFDVGETSVSSIYAMFDPTATSRSLGIFTLLKEIEFALANDKTYFHLGYAYEGESFYDYKKRFRALESFDWMGNWVSSASRPE